MCFTKCEKQKLAGKQLRLFIRVKGVQKTLLLDMTVHNEVHAKLEVGRDDEDNRDMFTEI